MSDKKGVQGTNAKDYENPEGVGGQQQVVEKRAGVANDAIYDGASNTKPSGSGIIAHTRDAAVDETHQVERITSTPGDDDKQALDVSISDGNGQKYTELNPLPVYNAESPGAEINDYDVAVDVLANAGGVATHDYTVSGSVEFKVVDIRCAATNEGKFDLEIETGVATGIFNVVDTALVSASSPTTDLRFYGKVAAGVIIRVSKTNFHNKDNNMYSTIQGLEI